MGILQTESFLINQQKGQIKQYTMNPLSENTRKILFFSDPPHLIKTSRNGLVNRNMEASQISMNKHSIMSRLWMICYEFQHIVIFYYTLSMRNALRLFYNICIQ